MVDFPEGHPNFFSLSEFDKLGPGDIKSLNSIWNRSIDKTINIKSEDSLSFEPYPLYIWKDKDIWNFGGYRVMPRSISIVNDVVFREWDFYVSRGSDGKMMKNSIGGHNAVQDPEGNKLKDNFKPLDIQPLSIEGFPVLLCNDGWRNYWHWHAQTMLSIYFLKEVGLLSDVKFVCGKLNSWQKQCVAALGVEESQIVEIPGGYHSLKKILYPSFMDTRSFLNIDPMFVEMFDFLTSKNRADFPQACYDRLIYVSREDAPHRNLLNERELFDCLKKLGFQKVVPSRMTYLQQMATFSNADVVIGVHGAGLTNIGFCKKSTLVLEICDANYMNYVYYVLSRLRGCKYECILTSRSGYQNEDNNWIPDIGAIMQSVVKSVQKFL